MAQYACERSRQYKGLDCTWYPVSGKRLLIHIPNNCKSPEFLRRLKDKYGFSLLLVGLEQIEPSKFAGWKDDEMVLWVTNGAHPYEVRNATWDATAGAYRGFHAVYIDEPHKDPKWGEYVYNHDDDKLQTRLDLLYQWVKNNLRIPFIIGDFNRPDVNWWRHYWNAGSCDSVIYTGYHSEWGASDQRVEWDTIIAEGAGGGRGWIHIYKDEKEYDSLFKYGNDHNFSEMWLFANEEGFSCEGIEYQLDKYLRSAVRNGWLTMKCEMLSRWETQYCRYRNCALCDSSRPEDWLPYPPFPRSQYYHDPREPVYRVGMQVFSRAPVGW